MCLHPCSYSMVIGGRALVHCKTADYFRHLFYSSFPEVREKQDSKHQMKVSLYHLITQFSLTSLELVVKQVALIIPDSSYNALAAAPLQAFPTLACSRFNHNRAVLVGAAAHAMFPDTQLSTDASFEVMTPSSVCRFPGRCQNCFWHKCHGYRLC